jgi:predicted NUDIX family NTP pyrophosphohydrolase
MAEQSAGCVVIKHFNGVPHVLLAHAAGNWKPPLKLMGIPKGHVEAGEDIKRAAARETYEEVGIKPDILDYLGSVTTNQGKKVHGYIALMKSGELDGKKATKLHRFEIDYAKFFPIEEAVSMVYAYQRPLIQRAIEYIEREHLR